MFYKFIEFPVKCDINRIHRECFTSHFFDYRIREENIKDSIQFYPLISSFVFIHGYPLSLLFSSKTNRNDNPGKTHIIRELESVWTDSLSELKQFRSRFPSPPNNLTTSIECNGIDFIDIDKTVDKTIPIRSFIDNSSWLQKMKERRLLCTSYHQSL